MLKVKSQQFQHCIIFCKHRQHSFLFYLYIMCLYNVCAIVHVCVYGIMWLVIKSALDAQLMRKSPI